LTAVVLTNKQQPNNTQEIHIPNYWCVN